MTPANLLVLMSDEHNPKFLGAAGHPFIATPNLDALAARGTRFTSAYTACPICVPARASFAVGRYVHDIGYWDNADAYEGAIPSWHHALRDAGHRVVSIGKLHFRGRKGDDHGFSEEIVPMHIVDGIGDVKGLIRERIPTRKGGDKMARRAGPGESPYTVYDREIASRAQIWLHEEAPKWRDRPWVLFVSFVAPHFPLTAPARWFYRYWRQDLPLPKLYAAAERPHHPFIDDYARTVDYDPHFTGPADVKRAIAGYSGLVSSMDENVGDVLQALRDAGLEDDTRVLYTSDHGDNVGARGLWGKSTFYEESAGVPLIVAGPDVPAGRVVSTPVSHIDCAPTHPRGDRGAGARGRSAATRRVAVRGGRGCGAGAPGDLASITRSVPLRARSCCASAGGSIATTSRIRRSSSTSRPIRRNWPTSRRMAGTPASSPRASGACAPSSIRKRSTRAPSGASRNCSPGMVAATRPSRAATWASRRRPAPRRKSTEATAAAVVGDGRRHRGVESAGRLAGRLAARARRGVLGRAHQELRSSRSFRNTVRGSGLSGRSGKASRSFAITVGLVRRKNVLISRSTASVETSALLGILARQPLEHLRGRFRCRARGRA